MMCKVYYIAINTFMEAVRDRVLYLLLAFALLMILSSRILSLLTVGDESKIIKDLGLSSISIFGVLIAIFVGIGLVYKEIEKKTIYTIISKPISRSQFLVGKYLGLLLTIFINVAIMSAGLLLLLFIHSGVWELHLLKAVLLIFCETIVITAFAILFSTFSTPMLSAIFTLSVYVIGHITENLYGFTHALEEQSVRFFCSVAYYMLPNLQHFDIKAEVVYEVPIGSDFIFYSLLYCLLYSTITILFANLIFSRRDFT